MGCASAVFLFFGTKHHILLAQPLPALLQEGGMVQAGGAEKLAGIRHTNFYGHIPLEHGENQLQMPELAAIKARDLENELLGLLLGNAFALQIEDALFDPPEAGWYRTKSAAAFHPARSGGL